MKERCSQVKEDGIRCGAEARYSGKCLFHPPEKADELRQARSRGGKGRQVGDGGPVVDETSREARVYSICRRTVRDVRMGKMEAKSGSAIASLCSVMLKAISAMETDKRVDDVEKQLGELRGALAGKSTEELLSLVEKGRANGLADEH